MLAIIRLQQNICRLIEQDEFFRQQGIRFCAVPPKNMPFPLVTINNLALNNISTLAQTKYSIELVLEILTRGSSNLLCLQALQHLQQLSQQMLGNISPNDNVTITTVDLIGSKVYYNAKDEFYDGNVTLDFTAVEIPTPLTLAI